MLTPASRFGAESVTLREINFVYVFAALEDMKNAFDADI